MHANALNFYASVLSRLDARTVLEFGSCNLNGSPRDVYHQAASWHGVDVVAGVGVDEVADAATWDSDRRFDVVICAEVFEHTPDWRLIVDNAYAHLNDGGMFLATCATANRPPHSAVDGGMVRAGEWYANVDLTEMRDHLAGMGWDSFTVVVTDGHFGQDDLQVEAIR